ncbi:tripartite tricarboxylate transporter substrate binding protein, partial [Achromobacter sp. Marseille-Q0513]|uniref:Bug family tripartite tricarboxylate transporter substrate binding protein n=1 Tax=Achromobacter sp. Marseille-Q0513 TaxID=2829161 RepID=UPI001B9EE877
MSIKTRAAATALALAAAACGATAHAAYPEQPIKIVVPFTPGGATDSVARLLASKLSGKLGQPVIIENRPGASTVIGAEVVARARPDGYTLMVSGSTTYSVLPALKTNLPYDPLRSYEHIAIVSLAPLVLLARKDLPATTAGEAAELARKQTGKNEVRDGTRGKGSGPQQARERCAGGAGARMPP